MVKTPPALLPNFSIDTALLARKIYSYLTNGGEFTSKRDIHKFLATTFGVEPSVINDAITRLVIDPRAIDEAYEYAQVLCSRDLARATSCSHEETLRQFTERYQQQLAVSQRDTTVMQHQQYSTPLPLCYLLGRYLGLDQDGLYDEPTAGERLTG